MHACFAPVTKWLLDQIDGKGKGKERGRGIATLFLICNMSQHLLTTLCLLPLVHSMSSCLLFQELLAQFVQLYILFSFFGDSNSVLVASPLSSLCISVFRIYLEIISSHFLCLFDLYSQALFLYFYPHPPVTSLLLFWFLWFFFFSCTSFLSSANVQDRFLLFSDHFFSGATYLFYSFFLIESISLLSLWK